jgi:TolB-like protein
MRVGIAYVVIGWLLVQVAEFAFENFGAPEWVLKTFVVVVLLGLPLALFFAWAFELTAEGVKREKDVDRSQSITPLTGRRLDFVIIGALVVALGYFIWERQTLVAPVDSSEEANLADVEAASTSTSNRRSIAVLPFVNMSSDEEQSWFADGLTEEILNALARAPDLLVTARTSSFAFKGSTADIPTIANALGVEHILEGSVRRGGGRLRITAQLIRAQDGFHLWSQTFDRISDDLIAIQEEIAIQIAKALDTAMDPDALAEMVSAGTSSVPAFEAYLEGLGYIGAGQTSGDVYLALNAREAAERAIAIDPEFAAAYFQLYIFWRLQLETNQILYGLTDLSLEERKANRDEMLDKAIQYEKDPTTKLRYRANKAALRLISEFLEARPNDERETGIRAVLLRRMGKDAELNTLIKRIYERDGLSRDFANWSLQGLRGTDDAEFMRTVSMDAISQYPDDVFLLYQAHRLLLWAGDIDGASRVLPMLINSDLPEQNRELAKLRQRCAELRMLFAEYDERGDFVTIATYLGYEHFDPTPYPNFMQSMAGQGIEDRRISKLPYRCNR